MSIQLEINKGLASYHSALNLPKDLMSEYSQLIDQWVANHGIEWTVSRCKIIYTDYVRYRAGLPCAGSWYAKNKSGLPKGVISRIFKLGISSKRKRFECGTLLRAYTRYVAPDLTVKQLSKFMEGVTCEDTPLPEGITRLVVEGADRIIGQKFALFKQPSYLTYTPAPGKRVPLFDGGSAEEETHWNTQWLTVTYSPTGRRMTEKYPDIFRGVFTGFHRRLDGNIFPSGLDAVGKIGLIQEPGYKLRAVANPNRVYQTALKPLGDSIYQVLKDLPWDCTFDQGKGFSVIQQHLQNKLSCYCYDLTGATDYFPLSLQMTVLNHVFPNMSDYVSLFQDLSRSYWVMGSGDNKCMINWTRGQPLGLYPSFGAFALTHGLLLFALNNFIWDKKFFVLGDDVIILDQSLAALYRRTLDELKCPISEPKSISSSLLAEFGGKVITADAVEPQLKWRKLSDDNFVDVIRLLGVKALRLLRPQQRRVAKQIIDIPDFLGGCGLNPHGIPLADRVEKYLHLFGEDRAEYLMSYDGQLSKFFNTSNEYGKKTVTTVSQEWDSQKLPDLDQRSASLLIEHLPSMIRWQGIMGVNLYTVVPVKGSLPIVGQSDYQSLLQKLQRKLK